MKEEEKKEEKKFGTKKVKFREKYGSLSPGDRIALAAAFISDAIAVRFEHGAVRVSLSTFANKDSHAHV